MTWFQVAIVVALVLILMLGVVISRVRSRPKVVRVLNSGTRASAAGSADKAGVVRLAVHVAGAVKRPGLYQVAEGSRVADALSTAGGPAPDAVLDNLNLAARLKDGEKVMVPRSGQVAAGIPGVPGGESSASGTSTSVININIAGVDELERLPGVGPALARRIVEYRQKNGQFSSVQELDNVEGIGPGKMESLKDLVTI